MLSYTFINSDSKVNDPGPRALLCHFILNTIFYIYLFSAKRTNPAELTLYCVTQYFDHEINHEQP